MRRALDSLALGAALLAAGCGQKGPLYLPDKNAPVATTQAPQPQPAPAESVPAPASPPAAQPKPTDQNSEDSGAPK
jgi:predicted small lipoprotein YifL